MTVVAEGGGLPLMYQRDIDLALLNFPVLRWTWEISQQVTTSIYITYFWGQDCRQEEFCQIKMIKGQNILQSLVNIIGVRWCCVVSQVIH